MELIIIIIAAFAIFILLARLIGWALGLTEIRLKSETLIKQNNQILDALDSLIDIQAVIAKRQGIEIKEAPEDE